MYDITAPPILRFVRQASALSQQQLAERAGTTQAVVSRIESGQASPSLDMVKRLVNAAGYELRLECTPLRVIDPVVETYKPGVDRTMLIANLRRTPRERFKALLSMQAFAARVRKAGEKARKVAEPARTFSTSKRNG